MVLRKNYRVLKKHPVGPQQAGSSSQFEISVVLESEVSKEALLFHSSSVLSLYLHEVEPYSKTYGLVTKAYGCLGLLCINQEDAVLKYLVLVTGCSSVAKVGQAEIYRLTQVSFVGLTPASLSMHVTAVSKLLSSGHFYFSVPGDSPYFSLASSSQHFHQGTHTNEFTWNRSMLQCLADFGVSVASWCTPLVCGAVEVKTVYVGAEQVKCVLLSRVSCERAGTRFNVRGVDDQGHVANFVETEQRVYRDAAYSSFLQVRGTLPVFWKQSSSAGRGNVTLTRGFECTQSAFERHCARLISRYGRPMLVNLLGSKGSDHLLTEAYQDHYSKCRLKDQVDLVCFDYHHHIASSSKLDKMSSHLYKQTQGFLKAHNVFLWTQDGKVVSNQSGVLRTNCMDSLDRTNVTQMFHATEVLAVQLSLLGLEEKMYQRFANTFATCWESNGDSLSWIYAGSGALKKNSKLLDGSRSVQRAIQNKFSDSSKQDAVDKLLSSYAYWGEVGRQTRALLRPQDAHTAVTFRKAMIERFGSFSKQETCRVAMGTWNVNGGKHLNSIAFKQSSLLDWLLEPYKEALNATANPADIFAVGFEELVDLKPSALVHTSSTNRKEWGVELEKMLSQKTPYVLLTAEQMVGICLFIFVRPHLVPFIRDVCVSTVKTGLGNRAGNKGAIAIRFLLHSTSLCFVCSHLAAHQSHVQERNSDFQEILKKISFSRGGSLETEDYVFWCGDLNYRIDMGLEECKGLISSQSWSVLSAADQLVREKGAGRAFQGFSEGRLCFAPTYKYDQFSEDYDTSEKGRIPAWTDRVLWRRRPQGEYPLYLHSAPALMEGDVGRHGSDVVETCGEDLRARQPFWHPGRLMFYGRAELKTSDHRPVVAVFDVDVVRVEERLYSRVREEVQVLMGPSNPTVSVQCGGGAQLDGAQLQRMVMEFGWVVMMRPVEGGFEVMLHDSQAALRALALDGRECDGVRLKVCLKSSAAGPVDDPAGLETSRDKRSSYINLSEQPQPQPEQVQGTRPSPSSGEGGTDLIQESSDEEEGEEGFKERARAGKNFDVRSDSCDLMGGGCEDGFNEPCREGSDGNEDDYHSCDSTGNHSDNPGGVSDDDGPVTHSLCGENDSRLPVDVGDDSHDSPQCEDGVRQPGSDQPTQRSTAVEGPPTPLPRPPASTHTEAPPPKPPRPLRGPSLDLPSNPSTTQRALASGRGPPVRPAQPSLQSQQKTKSTSIPPPPKPTRPPLPKQAPLAPRGKPSRPPLPTQSSPL